MYKATAILASRITIYFCQLILPISSFSAFALYLKLIDTVLYIRFQKNYQLVPEMGSK